MIGRGSQSEALEYLEVTRRSASTQIETLFIKACQAHIYAVLGEVGRAAEYLGEVSDLLTDIDVDDLWVQYSLGVYHSAHGLLALIQEAPIQARNSLDKSAGIFRDLDLPWKQSAILINLACLAIQEGDYKRALFNLKESEGMLLAVVIPDEWRNVRTCTIATNRASALALSGDLPGGIAVLVEARQTCAKQTNKLLLAIIDVNLAQFYSRSGRYGSALESAESSYKNYLESGAETESSRAAVCAITALCKLGRFAAAESLAGQLMDPSEIVRLKMDSPEWRWALVDCFSDIYRHTNRESRADQLEELRLEAFQSGKSFGELLEVMGSSLALAVNGIVNHKILVPPWLMEREYRDLVPDTPVGEAAVAVFECLRELFVHGRWCPEDLRPYEDVLRLNQIDLQGFLGLGEYLSAYQSDDIEAQLTAILRSLYNAQIAVSLQENGAYRSRMHVGRSRSDIFLAFSAITSLKQWETQFELIEFLRRENTNTATAQPIFGLPVFGELSDGLRNGVAMDDHLGADSLLPSVPYTVRGKSAIGASIRSFSSSIDADDVRQGLGGKKAAWFNLFCFGDVIHWGLLGDSFIVGGRIDTSGAWREALRRHKRMLPVPIEGDQQPLDINAPRWCMGLVAIARASLGGLLDDHALAQSCIRALPERYREAVSEYIQSASVPDWMSVYSRLAETLLVPELREYIAANEHPRLLISPPHELGTISFGLLPVAENVSLLESSTIQIVPPSFLIGTILSRREEGAGRHRLALVVANATGDLQPSEAWIDGAQFTLTGRSEAGSLRSVATRRATLASLEAFDERTSQGSIFAFVGHIRPGSVDYPESAALVLAPERIGDGNSHLSAADLLRSSVRIPRRVYLGGCEGAGFDTGIEWGSVSTACIARGASSVLAHGWPIVDGASARTVDAMCIGALECSAGEVARQVQSAQAAWLRGWRTRQPHSVAPYHWAALHLIGRG